MVVLHLPIHLLHLPIHLLHHLEQEQQEQGEQEQGEQEQEQGDLLEEEQGGNAYPNIFASPKKTGKNIKNHVLD